MTDQLEKLRASSRLVAASRLDGAEDARLRGRLFDKAPARRWPWLLAAGVACATAVALMVVRHDEHLGELVVRDGCAGAVNVAGEVTVGSAPCRVEDVDRRFVMELTAGARLRREPAGTRVLRGRARFAVAKRGDEPPFEVRVSHGVIVVIGTVFVVEQGDGVGSVVLEEGRIAFRGDDGTTRTMDAGERVEWADRVVQAVPEQPEAAPVLPSKKPDKGPRPTDLAQILEQLEGMRAQGRYAEAVTFLQQEASAASSAAVGERLSYEIGSLLTYQLGDTKRACAHWLAHKRKFGAKDSGVDRAEKRLTCPAPSNP